MSGSANATSPDLSSEPVTGHDKLTSTDLFDTVSKRSVERRYYIRDPQYFRHFVRKPHRRSALLNRLYWLRLKAVEHVVHRFLEDKGKHEHKVIINLGCGSDVLAWKMNHRYPDSCINTRFIDVDLPKIANSKRDTILQTPGLLELLGCDHRRSDQQDDPLALRSQRYCLASCDFNDSRTLRETVKPLVRAGSHVIVLAEMSLIYHDAVKADRVLAWAKDDLHAEFCLLEHCLPSGPEHPFSASLLRDYEKAETPLKSLQSYPTLETQRQRFKYRRWRSVEVWNLWELWTKDEFIGDSERKEIRFLEPFDDWEDLILLARHLCVVHASHSQQKYFQAQTQLLKPQNVFAEPQIMRRILDKCLRRRFGGILKEATTEGAELFTSIYGQGKDGLANTYDVFTTSKGDFDIHLQTSGPPPRSCFALSDLGFVGVLLTGGKSTTVGQPLSDCWLYTRGLNPFWKKLPNLPTGLYRHSSIRLGQSSMVLVLGGRTARGSSPDSYLFHPETGWHKCVNEGFLKLSFFGVAAWNAIISEEQLPVGTFEGFVCGGVTDLGAPNLGVYRWRLDATASQPSIHFEHVTRDSSPTRGLATFGALVVATDAHVFLIGGIGTDDCSDCLGQTILKWPLVTKTLQSPTIFAPSSGRKAEWPLMLGSSAALSHDYLLVVGGGTTAIHHSHGVWTEGLYAIKLGSTDFAPGSLDMRLLESPRVTTRTELDGKFGVQNGIVAVTPIPRIRLTSTEDFRTVLQERRPVIIEGLNFGPCSTMWTPQYLCSKIGTETMVTFHESTLDNPRLDFNSKNFKYVTGPFGDFIAKMQSGARVYLRALSKSKPSDIPANLDDDYPNLAPDFRLPTQLSFAINNLFSSILRLSGRANMWLHYDVMANIYTQIRGTKQMILFPPRDAGRLAFAPGASSSSFDVFSALGTEAMAGTQPYEAVLGEGDALFLPAAWLHTAKPLTDMSVAVNVFFRDLEGGYAEGRDVYGNRDLAAYEKGRQDAARIVQSFRNVPHDMRQFYLSRIAEELFQLAEKPQ